MNHLNMTRYAGLLAVTLCLGVLNVRAQDQSEDSNRNDAKPKPAARGVSSTDIDQQEPPNPLQPDSTPLTGAQEPTLGTSELRHSFWVPGVQVATTIQSSGYRSWLADNYLIGSLSLLKAWSRSSFAVNYSGGGHISTDTQRQPSGAYQELALSQTFELKRLTLQFLDDFSYLPQSQFGFGGGTPLGDPGAGGYVVPTIPGLGGNYVPNQSIYASLGPRMSNAGVIQSTYVLSPRGSLTASGSYGILHFTDPGNIDNYTTIASLGYNYILNHEDTVGVVYRFSGYHYPGQPQAIGDQSFDIAYSRRITGRLALSVSGGPDWTTFRVPIGKQKSKLSANASVGVNYAIENGGLMLNYFHGIGGGGGLFTGSITDTVTAGLKHGITRIWSGQINMGYARNRSVAANPSIVTTTLPNYTSWFLGGGVGRPIGRNFNFAASYTANIGTTTTQAGCKTNCASTTQTYNYITLSLQWHPRPMALP